MDIFWKKLKFNNSKCSITKEELLKTYYGTN